MRSIHKKIDAEAKKPTVEPQGLSDLNFLVVTGRLTDNPVLGYTGSGAPMLKFLLAVNNNVPRRDQDNHIYEWLDWPSFIMVYYPSFKGERIAEYLQKGRKVLVEGRLHSFYKLNQKDEAPVLKSRLGLFMRADKVLFIDSQYVTPKSHRKQPPPGGSAPGSGNAQSGG